LPLLRNVPQQRFSSGETLALTTDGSVHKIVLPLANGDCLFSFSSGNTVKDLIGFIHEEDFGADVSIWCRNHKVSGSTELRDILSDGFEIKIRGTLYKVPQISTEGTLAFRGIIDANALLQKEKYNKIRHVLKDDVRNAISISEFFQLCERHNISQGEARQVLKALHHAGLVLHFEQNKLLSETIFLHPREITQQVLHSLEVPPTIVADIDSRISEIQVELKPLTEVKARIDLAATKHANRSLVFGFLALCGQFAFLARLVWWELNWDIMEPVAYFIGLATTMGGFVFFSFTGRDYGFRDLWEHVRDKKKRKLAAKENFDEGNFKDLVREMEELVDKKAKIHLKAKMT